MAWTSLRVSISGEQSIYIYRRVMNLSEIQRKIVIEARLIYN